MLSSAELSCRAYPSQTRRAMPQLPPNFLDDLPLPETCLWDQFNDEQKRILVETLARLMTKAARASDPQEQSHD
jgi:hypothetical protein